MTAQFFTPVFDAPNAVKADANHRVWGSYDMPAAERKRQEKAGVIKPRKVLAVGIIMDGSGDTFTRRTKEGQADRVNGHTEF